MGDRLVDKWTQTGEIWIWKYKGESKNYPGFHMTTDRAASPHLVELANLMLKGQWPSSKVLRLSEAPVPDVTGYSRQRQVLSSLRLKYPKGSVADEHWDMALDGAALNATLTVGATKLKNLREGIDGISRSKGDYAIGPDDDRRWSQQCLWFWW